jgi:hypothetical protein
VLYAILAGRAPYLAESVEDVLRQARTGQMPALSEVPLGLPLLARVCQAARRAMAMDPRNRHQSVFALKREIEESLHGGPEPSVETTAAGESAEVVLDASVHPQD